MIFLPFIPTFLSPALGRVGRQAGGQAREGNRRQVVQEGLGHGCGTCPEQGLGGALRTLAGLGGLGWGALSLLPPVRLGWEHLLGWR